MAVVTALVTVAALAAAVEAAVLTTVLLVREVPAEERREAGAEALTPP